MTLLLVLVELAGKWDDSIDAMEVISKLYSSVISKV